MGIGLVVGDDAPDLADAGDHRQAALRELARVGDDGHFARHPDHQRVQLRLEHVRRGQADLGVEAVHAEEQVVRVQAAQHLLGLRPDGRVRHVAHQPADDDETHVRQVGEVHRHVQAVRDHRQGVEPQRLDLLRDLGGRRSRVENDRVGACGSAARRRVRSAASRDGSAFP